jgi:hypothetical protein
LGGKIEETDMGEEKRDCHRPERVRAEAPCYLGNLHTSRERQLRRVAVPALVYDSEPRGQTLPAVGQPAKDAARTDEEETYCRQPPASQNTRMHRHSGSRQ